MQTIDHKILIVEDEIVSRMQIKRHLARFKGIYEAGDLDETFEQLVKHDDVDLILLDLGLPGSQGADTVEQVVEFIRERNRVTDAPIVVLTGNTDPDILQAALVAGAQEHLDKNRIDGYVVEKTIGFAIRNKAREAVLMEQARLFRQAIDMEFQQANRKIVLMHSLPEVGAFNELRAIHQATAAVPRTANRDSE